MHLSSIRLTNFKNYEQQTVECSPALNAFVGRNGSGKTNLLEAIYYLCMGKSYFNTPDQFVVRHGEDFFRLQGHFSLDAGPEEDIVIKVQRRKRKVIERRGVAYQRLSEHVGRFPVVIIVPDDTQLIQEGSELRRRLLDNTLSQIDNVYLQHLIEYNRLLRQRNALIKQYGERPAPEDLLRVYDEQLAGPATYIFGQRRTFAEQFRESVRDSYAAIAEGAEEVDITYKSQLHDTGFLPLQQERRRKDSILQRTTGGIHRDDLVFSLQDHPLKRVASQGQLKTFVLALKLAQFQLLKAARGRTPILLLDDIFDKLDPDRVAQLLKLILQEEYGQIFLSDTDPGRVGRITAGLSTTVRLYRVEEGHAQQLQMP